MRKFAVTALAALAAVGATVALPSKADAQVVFGFGGPGFHVGVGHWGHGYGHGFYRPHRPRAYRYIDDGYYRPACWVERRWVHTPFGPEPRRVRICR